MPAHKKNQNATHLGGKTTGVGRVVLDLVPAAMPEQVAQYLTIT